MTEFLFSPERVDRLLACLPALDAVVPPRKKEGRCSTAFPGLRKTRRQLYRLLTNPHYPGLRDALRAIDRTHAADCHFGELLTTADYELFQSHLSEVRAADHFLSRSLGVETIRRNKSRTPDLRVIVNDAVVTVEVFTRREWLDIDRWEDSVRDQLKNLDAPWNYIADVSTRSLTVAPWDPWSLADALSAAGSAAALATLVADFERAVEAAAPYHQTYEHTGVPLRTDIDVREIRTSEGAPARVLDSSVPGFGGYSPAGMLRRIIDGPVRDKASRGQAQTAAHGARCLLIDLSHSGIAHDLRAPAHNREAEKVVASVDPTDYGLDVIVFFKPYVGQLRGRCDYFATFDYDRVSRLTVQAMFGEVPAAPAPSPG